MIWGMNLFLAVVSNEKDVAPSRALQQAWGELAQSNSNFSDDNQRNTQKSQR